MSWLSARQNAPEGGLSGRTNKLVDGCYSLWAGGCWPLLEAVLNGPCHKDNAHMRTSDTMDASGRQAGAGSESTADEKDAAVSAAAATQVDGSNTSTSEAEDSSVPFVESIMDREGLIRYILCCCQDERLRANAAGMRDKPGK